MRNLGRLSLEAAIVALFGLSIVSTLLFLAARPAGGFGQSGPCSTMPPDWEAGALNHGSCLRWHLIRHHPIEFVASLAGIILFSWVLKRMTRLRRSA
jgi:hypothetical protein